MPRDCELAGLEPDPSFPCFPEVVAIWDAVSAYILTQMKLDKVGWPLGLSLSWTAWALGSDPSLSIVAAHRDSLVYPQLLLGQPGEKSSLDLV